MNPCIQWEKINKSNGYGYLRVKGKYTLAHRWAYEQEIGPIPAGMVLDHICHNEDPSCLGGVTCPHRACCNTEHMVPKTIGENVMASSNTITAQQAAQTHCVHGHSLEDAYVSTGKRECRQCIKSRSHSYYVDNKEARKQQARERYANRNR